MTKSIAFVDLRAQYTHLKPTIDQAIARVLGHGRFIMGPEVAEFENALAEYANVGHAVTCASGTDALTIALIAENIGPGDAVFLPAFTFTATAEVVSLLGARPVFVDVDETSYLIDLADLEAKIAACERAADVIPRAVIAVDLFGQPADYNSLTALVEAHDLVLIADAAQSYGASYQGKPVGSLAHTTALSFFPAKPLGCYGDGGALMTDDVHRAGIYRSIRAHGKGGEKYEIVRLGLNSRLDTLQAAILLSKLTALDTEIRRREEVAQSYDEAFAALAGVGLPVPRADIQSAWAQYTVRLNERDRISDALKSDGVPTAVYYPLPMHLQPAYRQFGDGPGSLPVSERLCGEVLSLPIHGYMSISHLEQIISAFVRAVDQS